MITTQSIELFFLRTAIGTENGAEHRYLVALANNLHDSLGAGDVENDLSELFAHLIRYVGRHFRNEEALMKAIA